MADEKLAIVLSLFGIGFSVLAVIVSLGGSDTPQTARARTNRVRT